MSRGLGRVERRVLELLEGCEQLPAAQITSMIAGTAEPTPALAASVRRALGSLRQKGRLVQVEGRNWTLVEKWQRSEKLREREEERRREEKATAHEAPWTEVEEGCLDYQTAGRRLAKVLALLASPHDGEVISAARQAERIRRRLQLSWEEVISLPARLEPEPEPSTVRPGYGPNFAF